MPAYIFMERFQTFKNYDYPSQFLNLLFILIVFMFFIRRKYLCTPRLIWDVRRISHTYFMSHILDCISGIHISGVEIFALYYKYLCYKYLYCFVYNNNKALFTAE